MTDLNNIRTGVLHTDGKVSEVKPPELHEWYDTSDEQLYATDEINHGDWPFRFFLHVEYLDGALTDREIEEAGGDCDVSIVAVSPVAAEDELLSALKSCSGWETIEEMHRALPDQESQQRCCYECLLRYGVKAHLWNSICWEADLDTTKEEAKRELASISFLFGFYMDRPENAIGNTGWDFITGQIGFTKG